MDDAAKSPKQSASPAQEAPASVTDPPVLDVQELAKLSRIPKATILTLRSRAPDKLPPPFRKHPLLWRRQTVLKWMEREEQLEADRIASLTQRRTRR